MTSLGTSYGSLIIRITTFNIMGVNATLSINNALHNNVMINATSFIVTLRVIMVNEAFFIVMPNGIMLSVVMLSVVAPLLPQFITYKVKTSLTYLMIPSLGDLNAGTQSKVKRMNNLKLVFYSEARAINLQTRVINQSSVFELQTAFTLV